MKNQYDKFLNQLEENSDGGGFQIVEPEIWIIGDPPHCLIVPRPFTPEETHLWVEKYGKLTRPGYVGEENSPTGDNQEPALLDQKVTRI